ncbi:MAG: tRNA preQ1(34) S-adenosylmethionine ribosyltransferase-isomerase QueA [Planctomycetota bacterium]|nr:MAG: tRNA preQ1(34) S-adenosylmethionine ribosyltransferase-isomerase QueA [Planctomycetota bacterium]
MLPTRALEYDLPTELIATAPATPRDSARLLVVSRSDPALRELTTVRQLPGLLQPGDAVVVNNSRVLRARLVGRKVPTGGRVEGLFLEEQAPGVWLTALRANSPLRPGLVVALTPPCPPASREASCVELTLLERRDRAWLVRAAPPHPAETLLEQAGRPPLPPYILSARKKAGLSLERDDDAQRYQTVYARAEAVDASLRSVAAPTAGLHFTPRLLDELDARGLARVETTLAVGPGTFLPVETDTLEEHPMHAERLRVGAAAQRRLAAIRKAGGRIVAVGTTTARALESIPPLTDPRASCSDIDTTTTLLIAPGHTWRNVDALLTNFHLPRSTLLAMVAALFPGGVEELLAHYRFAIERRLRFYSFGDAMLILP